MIGPRIQSLRVVPGEYASASKWNGLLDLVDEMLRVSAGPNVIKRSLPTATIIRTLRSPGRGAGGSSYPFKAKVAPGEEGEMQVSFNKGLIAGVEPRIGDEDSDKLISDDTGDDGPPLYTFSLDDAIDEDTGQGMLYWELKFNPDYSITKIYPKAYAQVPAAVDYTALKLIGFLNRDPDDEDATPTWTPQLFYNLNHVASQRHGGRALHRFWVE